MKTVLSAAKLGNGKYNSQFSIIVIMIPEGVKRGLHIYCFKCALEIIKLSPV